MREWVEVSGKSIEEALIEAAVLLQTPIENIEYEILEKENSGFLGINKKSAKIKAAVKNEKSRTEEAFEFVNTVLSEMGISTESSYTMEEEGKLFCVNVSCDEKGILIGKRGQTLDSIQYLTSIVLNKDSEDYVRVRIDTENYRERRKASLERLAKGVASKVKRTRKSVALEPMNPYERRIIHSALQFNKYVETHSEGVEPFRKVIVSLKKGVALPPSGNRRFNNSKPGYNKSGYGKKPYSRPGYNKSGYDRPSYNRSDSSKPSYKSGSYDHRSYSKPEENSAENSAE